MDTAFAMETKRNIKRLEAKMDKLLLMMEEIKTTKAYTSTEASQMLGISRRQIGRLMDKGELGSVRVGRKIMVTAESLARYQRTQGLI